MYNGLFLDKPVCVENQRNIYGVSEGEKAHITCKVDAFPEAESFSWSYNTTSGIVTNTIYQREGTKKSNVKKAK